MIQVDPQLVAPFQAPAWIVSVATGSYFVVRTLLSLRSNGNGQSTGTHDAEWRGRMIQLAEQQEKILDRVASQQNALVGVVERLGSLAGDTMRLLRSHDEWERIRAAKEDGE